MESDGPQQRQVPDLQPASFEFVASKDYSHIRSHAMRESWRRRSKRAGNTRSAKSPRDSEILVPAAHINDENSDPAAPKGQDREPAWTVSNVPGFSQQILRQPEGRSMFDPFDCLSLDADDQMLLYHWVNTYALQAFGQPEDPIFSPMRDLYVPIDLSHKAATHAVLAHSASYVAYLKGERNSTKAIQHKVAAIRLVNEYLSDPKKSVSDETFSAVLRLLTFERYWGTEKSWRLHRKGLAQMVRRRGGLSTFRTDWRIAVRIQIISVLLAPAWKDPVFAENHEPDEIDYHMPHSDFINFFQSLNTDNMSLRHRFPAIARAMIFLRSSKGSSDEEDRLMCLFYMAIINTDSSRRHYDLSWLDDSLSRTEDIWACSVRTMRWLLMQGMGRGPGGPDAMAKTERLKIVAKGLGEDSWMPIEDRLLRILYNPRDRDEVFMEECPSA